MTIQTETSFASGRRFAVNAVVARLLGRKHET